MQSFKIKSTYKKLLADTITPVSIYLSLRDKYPGTILLESSDYHSRENCFSYICCQATASFKVKKGQLHIQYPDGSFEYHSIADGINVVEQLQQFSNSFQTENTNFKFATNGLFGYMSYDAVQHFEDIELNALSYEEKQIPEIHYQAFQFVIVIDHYKNELYLFEHLCEENQNAESDMESIAALIQNHQYANYPFQTTGEEESNYTDNFYAKMIEKGKAHCQRGDVFQIVLSREFQQPFQGDEFNVYRALRAINPSPYLFYFDYGDFKIFGSSPEAQLTIKNQQATINPIAGTYKRSGNETNDLALAEKLKADPKENAEHVMLVDLARNDLSRNASNVGVETFSEIQFYSHVIHMVSKVSGKLLENTNTIRIAADTFPAGTLSGAPKYKAMQLIDKYEERNRSFYGGAIGFMSFDGDFNHAIIIRSFLSRKNRLIYQAGAGIVASSDTESEVQEVFNKIGALRNAIQNANEI